jgi:hypothetical protein
MCALETLISGLFPNCETCRLGFEMLLRIKIPASNCSKTAAQVTFQK